MIQIEKLSQPYLKGLKELYEDAFEGSFSDLEKMEERFIQMEKENASQILIALDGGEVVGSVMGVVCHELFGECRPFMVVENVAVLNSHRRKGIAKRLFVEIEEVAKAHDCSMILFVSSSFREGAHKLYASLGYGKDGVNGYRKRI